MLPLLEAVASNISPFCQIFHLHILLGNERLHNAMQTFADKL